MPPSPAPTLHQQYLGFPRLDEQIVDPETGTLIPSGWYRLLIDLWRRVGGLAPNLDTPSAAVLKFDSTGKVSAVKASNGQPLVVEIPAAKTAAPGAPGQAQLVTLSPFVFLCPAAAQGLLVVSSGVVTFSRDGANFFPCGLTGAAVRVLPGDQVSVVWSAQAPQIIFFPDF